MQDVAANMARSKRLYEEVFGRGNFDVADEILAPDATSHGAGAPPATGTAGIKAQAMALRAAMPDLATVLSDQFGSGDRVCSRWSATGTHTGDLILPFSTIPASGKDIAFEEIRIDRYEGGRIVESWFIPDRFTVWASLGMIRDRPEPAGT